MHKNVKKLPETIAAHVKNMLTYKHIHIHDPDHTDRSRWHGPDSPLAHAPALSGMDHQSTKKLSLRSLSCAGGVLITQDPKQTERGNPQWSIAPEARNPTP
jgi:hypothetical protein